VESAAGRVVARQVIVAMMPADVQRIAFDPPLPASRARLQQQWGTGSGMKVHLQYPTPFWRSQGLAGQAFSTGTLTQFTFDASPPDALSGVLLVFVDEQRVPRNPLQRRLAIVAEIAATFGPAAAAPIGYLEQNWSLQAWTAGCVSPLPPGLISRDGPSLREPLGRLHWAGTETAEVWNGYMDGAVRAGQRAAQAVWAQR
jgi:monoamine oxidase